VKVAYFVNQYPQPSHSFIRREMRELEAHGWTVKRFTIRPTKGRLVDPDDLDEQSKTRSILASGKGNILKAVLAAMTASPSRFWGAIKLAKKVAKPSGRGLAIHLMYLAEACVLLKWLREENIKHVHAHFGTNSTTVVMLMNALGGPTYSFTTHGPDEYDSPVALSLGEKIRRSAFAVGITNFGRSQLYRWVGHEHWDKIKIIHCGVDAGFLKLPPAPLPSEPRLVNVGRLSAAKGQLLLVQAAALLKKDGRPFQIDIIGDGDLRPALEKLVAELDVGQHVNLLGLRSSLEVRQAIDNSRAMVMPSFAEGLPVVIMEALSRHRPVISTAIAGIPDLVRQGQTAG
jgi:glycosyltransferase involved in cell wall biosynthesis